MKNSHLKSALVVFTAIFMACNVLAEEPTPPDGNDSSPMPVVLSDDFRVSVQTNRNVYHNRDVLRLTVRLLNNSPDPVLIGICHICPVAPAPNEPVEEPSETVEEGVLDDVDVDVAVLPPRRIIIGYATLTRLGASPMPEQPVDGNDAPVVQPKPKKWRLPLFGSYRVPGHSTRIISVANILLAGPVFRIQPEPAPQEPQPAEPPEQEPDDAKDIIPAVGRHVPLWPGYYLLNCRIRGIYGTQLAQAQKIIQIRPRIIRPVLTPTPRPRPSLREGR